MHIVDAIKALKGESLKLRQDLEDEKEAHMITMTERDDARAAEKLAVKLSHGSSGQSLPRLPRSLPPPPRSLGWNTRQRSPRPRPRASSRLA